MLTSPVTRVSISCNSFRFLNRTCRFSMKLQRPCDVLNLAIVSHYLNT